jgi:hypothetical protein
MSKHAVSIIILPLTLLRSSSNVAMNIIPALIVTMNWQTIRPKYGKKTIEMKRPFYAAFVTQNLPYRTILIPQIPAPNARVHSIRIAAGIIIYILKCRIESAIQRLREVTHFRKVSPLSQPCPAKKYLPMGT